MGYVVVNFEVASSSSFRNIPKNHFVTAAAEADIDDSIKRKRIRVSIKNDKNSDIFQGLPPLIRRTSPNFYKAST